MNPLMQFFSSKFNFGCTEIEYVGDSGYIRLDDDRRVRIYLDTVGIAWEYGKIVAVVLSKTKGQIVRQDFNFEDYLVRNRSIPRVFNRNGMFITLYTSARPATGIVAGYVWNEAPLSTVPIVEAICDWIDLFR